MLNNCDNLDVSYPKDYLIASFVIENIKVDSYSIAILWLYLSFVMNWEKFVLTI